MSKIADRLKSLRQEQGINQQKLTDDLGLSRSTIAGYETEKRNPDQQVLQSIADYFNVSTDYLLGRTDERSPADKIKEALSDYPELLEFWEEAMGREEVQLFLKEMMEIPPQTIINMVKAIKGFEDESKRRHGGDST